MLSRPLGTLFCDLLETVVEELLDTQIRKDIVPRRGGDQMFTKANIDKARRLLDYNPSTTLKEGLQKQIEWYKKEFVD